MTNQRSRPPVVLLLILALAAGACVAVDGLRTDALRPWLDSLATHWAISVGNGLRPGSSLGCTLGVVRCLLG